MSAISPIAVAFMIWISLMCSSGSMVHAADTPPDDMVKAGVAELADAARIYATETGDRERVLADAVRSFLAQYTDVHYAARLIFARHWDVTPPGQRGRFEDAFEKLVTYLLVKLVPGIDFGSVRIDPFLGDSEETPLTIDATFLNSDRQTVHFVLVIHENEGRWLIFDVIAEGISYVKIYRNQLSGEIADTGVEAMIERFEARSAGLGQQPQ